MFILKERRKKPKGMENDLHKYALLLLMPHSLNCNPHCTIGELETEMDMQSIRKVGKVRTLIKKYVLSNNIILPCYVASVQIFVYYVAKKYYNERPP